MRRHLLILSLAATALVLAGCGITVVSGSGKVVTQTRPVANFGSLTLTGLGDVTITQGSSESLTIEAEDNVITLIKTEVKAGNLNIYFDQQNWQNMIRPSRPIKLALGVKNLSLIDLTGAGNIAAPSLTGSALTIKVSGAGAVTIPKLQATDLKVTMSGLGNIALDGQVTSQQIELTGAGQYLAGNLSSQTTRINLAGTGNATVWAKQSLDVTIGGAGNVSYYGSPKLTKSITGLGLLNPMGVK